MNWATAARTEAVAHQLAEAAAGNTPADRMSGAVEAEMVVLPRLEYVVVQVSTAKRASNAASTREKTSTAPKNALRRFS